MAGLTGTGDGPDRSRWWRDAVVYQVYIRSFADSDGDGIGDIGGILSRLDHLVELGVDALWITPWYPSPQADGGYDVTDHRAVWPPMGDLAAADELIAAAHRRGLRILLDLVPNHTSDRHPWFRAARTAPPGSAERARYAIRPGRGPGGELPPNNWQLGLGGPAWSRLPDTGPGPAEWYLHLFSPEQPDLNWDNPQVRREFEDILRFWFDRGVDGFRIDVAHGLVKDPAYPDQQLDPAAGPLRVPMWDQDGVHEIYRSWRAIADGYPGERAFVAEAWVADPGRLARYLRPGELHSAFNFFLLVGCWQAEQLRTLIEQSLTALSGVDASPVWVLSNHDVVRHLTRYGRELWKENEPAGTVRTDLALGRRRARAAALLLLALPGGAYLYQGEELGLWEVEDLPAEALVDPRWELSGHRFRGRDGCRVPLPWSGSAPPFGFGPAGSTASFLPAPAAWAGYTVRRQRADPGSMLALYRAALRIRRRHPALGAGTLRWAPAPAGVLAFDRDPGFRFRLNQSGAAVPLPPHAEVLLASGPVGELAGGQLPPDRAVWLGTAD